MELSIHLLCGVQNSFMLEHVVGGSLEELGILERPITVNNGVGVPSSHPGHGILFDKAALQAYVLDADKIRTSFHGGSK
jgi:hypothetical protein